MDTADIWKNDPIVQLEKALGGITSELCFFLLGTSTGEDARSGQDLRAMMADAARVVDTVRFERFVEMDIDVDAATHQMADELVQTLTSLSETWPDEVEPKQLKTLSRSIQSGLEQKIQRTMDAFRASFITTVITRHNRNEQAAQHAQREIHNISRKIFFISINASVEASRAGDHGRGFNVISKEIRELARRAEDSMKTLTWN